jgi:hypothetical protein
VNAGYQPTNETERALLAALTADDQREYFRIMSTATLYLPDAGGGSVGEPQLLTWPAGDRRYLLVFTSVESLIGCVGSQVEGYRETSYAELARTWVNPAWGLAVDPDRPIGAFINVDDVARGAEGGGDLPPIDNVLPGQPVPTDFQPANDIEEGMALALRADDPELFLQALFAAPLFVPEDQPGGAVAVYTSVERLAQARVETLPYRRTGLVELLRSWADLTRGLSVNPGTAIEMEVAAEAVAPLAAALAGSPPPM